MTNYIYVQKACIYVTPIKEPQFAGMQ